MTRGVQAEVSRIVHEGKACVLKAARGGMFKPVSRWALNREYRVYQKLAGIEGIPKCFGKTFEGLMLEAIEGRPLAEFRKGEIPVEFLDAFDRLLAAIHARGVAHSDLKKRANILVMAGHQPIILDFGAAFIQGETLFETFRKIDLAAAAKLRAHHQPETLRPEQQAILDNPTWAERLSRFLIHTVRDPYRSLVARLSAFVGLYIIWRGGQG